MPKAWHRFLGIPLALGLILSSPALSWLAPPPPDAGEDGSAPAFGPPIDGPGTRDLALPLGASEEEARALLEAQLPRKKGYLLHHGPNPRAYKQLLENERAALERGTSPQALGAAIAGTQKILVLLAEF